MCATSGGCGQLSGVLMAATAALGYLVLHHCEKDAQAVRWAGRVVGWVLLVGGLGGFLCSTASHMKSKSCGQSTAQCHRQPPAAMPEQLPYGHPAIGDLPGDSFPTAPSKKKAK